MRYMLTLMLALMLAVPAYAADDSNNAAGGFQGPTSGVQADTVKKALDASDDTPVMLTGTITERKAGSDDKYLFKDNTGEVVVDIDRKVFAGRNVTPQTRVRLSGKVDKELMGPTKIDVKVLDILK